MTAGASSGSACRPTSAPATYAALARIAEEGGFDVVTTFNDLWYQPALPALLEIAAATERVRVGPSCLNPYTVHPVELAGQTAALDLASGGRAFLGLAAGAWLGGLGVEQRRPVETIAEAWEIVLAPARRRPLRASRARCSGSSRARASRTRPSGSGCRCSSAPGRRG